MKILHTADVHLVEAGNQRWDALVEVVSQAKHKSVDVLAISGDLFDSEANAEALRVPLRSIFEGADFITIIIPGNHDAEAYHAGLYFGKGVHVLRDPDWSKNIVDKDDVRFIGIPFESMEAQEFRHRLRALRNVVDANRTNILLYHGELLDVSFDRGSFGQETGRYMPSRLVFFEELGVDYVLAGHFHTTFDVREFREGGFFVYSGSPASITRREIGKRRAAIVEPGEEPISIPLETHHFERVEIMLDTHSDDAPLEIIKDRLDNFDRMATALLTVNGTIHGSEEELAEAIRAEIHNRNVEISDFGFRDLSKILLHPVFALFESHLDVTKDGEEDSITAEEVDQVREMMIQAMSEAGV